MSLTVTPEVLAQAERGELPLPAFVDVVRTSLPYFYERVELLAEGLGAGTDPVAVANDTPANDEEWGQLLRGFASDPIRGAMETHFGVRLGFRNCCFTAATRPGTETASPWTDLFTTRAQVLAQDPTLVNC